MVLFWPAWILWRRTNQARFIRTILASSGKSDAGRVIASLSTLPDRIHNLEPTIRCLLQQTRPPDEIVLAIPDFSIRQQKPYVVPEYLSRFSQLRVLRCSRDWGPATKFIPVIQEELEAGRSKTLILVVDDDRTYPRDALETYLHFHRQLPDAALCFRGAVIRQPSRRAGLEILEGSKTRNPKPVAVITGCGSYFIQPRFFDARLWDYSAAPAAAFYMDDIWISGWLDRRGMEKYVVPTSEMMRSVNQQSGTMTLHDVPNGRVQNNKEVIAFFQDTWKVLSGRSR
jgi:Glycosyl transferase family 2